MKTKIFLTLIAAFWSTAFFSVTYADELSDLNSGYIELKHHDNPPEDSESVQNDEEDSSKPKNSHSKDAMWQQFKSKQSFDEMDEVVSKQK